MPLTRATVTAASRVMLPAYAILTAAYGTVYLLNPWGRLDHSPAFTYPRMLMGGSLAPWGGLFLAVSVTMWIALIAHKRALYLLALSLFGSTFALWAILFAISVKVDPDASLTAPFHPIFYVACCIATSRSLLRGEHS